MLPTTSFLAIFAFSFAIAFGAVISPGPVSAAIVSQAPRHGWLAGPLVATGHSILELCIVVLITFGLSSALAYPTLQTAIALLGGLLLAWMGGKMLRDGWRGAIRLPGPDEAYETLSSRQLIGVGMAATISNPFWYAWWVTVAAGYLSQARLIGAAAVAAFLLGHISADYAWDTVLSAVVGGGRRWMSQAVYRALILACALFLIYLGVVFLGRGLAGLGL